MIRQATIGDIKEIMEIKNQAVTLMKEDNNEQWDENYPSKESFVTYIEQKEVYVAIIKGELVGMIVITTLQDEWYENVDWSIKLPLYTLHRLAIKEGFRGHQIASSLLTFAKKLAKDNNIAILKADTYSKNKRMSNLFAKNGFTFVGECYFNQKNLPYLCYEYVIDK